jgi:Dolichyl-phosphate-mannose-protein mannosyltransferase
VAEPQAPPTGNESTEPGVQPAAMPSQRSRRSRRPASSGAATTVIWVVTVGAVVIGTAARGWYLFHRPTTSDEAVGGLMASQFVHGHFSTFYWGQTYGGVESYLIAARDAVFGTSSFLLPLVAVLLSGAAGLVTWRIALRLVTDPAVAALAGAAAWAAPFTIPYNTAYEYSFRGATMFLGLVLILITLRIFDGDDRPVTFALLGLAAGLGWWSSPEIVYFGVPAAILLVVSIVGTRATTSAAHWVRQLAIVVVAAVVGALPWLWTNLHSGFASLKTNTFPVPVGSPHYVGRFKLFFHYSLPMLFSLRRSSGVWILFRPLAIALLALLLLALVVSVVLCLLGGWRSRAIAIGVMAFPFLVVLSPGTWYWQDGRYTVFVVPLLVLVLVFGGVDGCRRLQARREPGSESGRTMSRVLLSGLVALLVALSVINFNGGTVPLRQFFTAWGNPDGPTLATLAPLESHGIRDGYADYWIAYRLDFLSGGKLHLTVAGNDPDRWTSLNEEVLHAHSTAWIFVVPTPLAQAQFSGSAALGPGGLTESGFLADLQRQHIHFHIVRSGFVRAVVPDRPIVPTQVGVPQLG